MICAKTTNARGGDAAPSKMNPLLGVPGDRGIPEPLNLHPDHTVPFNLTLYKKVEQVEHQNTARNFAGAHFGCYRVGPISGGLLISSQGFHCYLAVGFNLSGSRGNGLKRLSDICWATSTTFIVPSLSFFGWVSTHVNNYVANSLVFFCLQDQLCKGDRKSVV